MRQIATHVVLSDIRQSLDRLPAGLIHNTPLILAVGSPATLQATFGERSVAIASLSAQRAALEVERAALQADSQATSVDVSPALSDIDRRLGGVTAQLNALEATLAAQQQAMHQLLALRQQWQANENSAERAGLQKLIKEAHQALPAGDAALLFAEVDEAAIARVIADWTGVPVGQLLSDELLTLLDLEQRLARTVIGQDAALASLAERLRAAKAGLTPEEAPLGVFLLVGPSGVGKTETARALADLMFGGEPGLITINLSEYQEAHTVSQLKGAPPGYVGYGLGGVLTEAVRQRPYSVILLDEVEKAHRDVLNLFYQVFDRGFMRDGEGRLIDFRNTVILMTSNLGSQQLMAVNDAFLQASPEAASDAPEQLLTEAILPIVSEHFQPALLARFQTVVYRPLGVTALKRIVRSKLDKVALRIANKFDLPLHYADEVIDVLASACQTPDSGARNIDSLLAQKILPVLSRELLSHAWHPGRPAGIRLAVSDEHGMMAEFDTIAVPAALMDRAP